MTEPTDFELLELATPYALHAVSDTERADIDRRVAAAPAAVAAAFNDEIRAVRETMAVLATASIADPPDQLRTAVLAAIQPDTDLQADTGRPAQPDTGRPAQPDTGRPAQPDTGRRAQPDTTRQSFWRSKVFASAAAVAIGLAGFGVGVLTRPHTNPTVAEQVMSAPDMKSVSRPLGTGQATVLFSRDRNAAVLVMNNVPPPSSGTVYQMWLLGADRPKSAGTMDATAVQPTTMAMVGQIGTCRALAFTVEPGTGSQQPTTPILAELPLK